MDLQKVRILEKGLLKTSSYESSLRYNVLLYCNSIIKILTVDNIQRPNLSLKTYITRSFHTTIQYQKDLPHGKTKHTKSNSLKK